MFYDQVYVIDTVIHSGTFAYDFICFRMEKLQFYCVILNSEVFISSFKDRGTKNNKKVFYNV